MNIPLISVRIPTKNRPRLLVERALASVAYQTYRNLEVVIVGDNCNIATANHLKNMSFPFEFVYENLPPRSEGERELMKDPQIRWFMGPVRATNRATELCAGEWIAPLDDDDIWTPEHIERSYNFAKENDYEFVSSKIIRQREGVYEEVGAEDGFGGCQTWLYKTEIAKRFPYNPDCWRNKINRVSDTDVAFRIQQGGVRIGFLNVVSAYVLPRPGETTVGLAAYLK